MKKITFLVLSLSLLLAACEDPAANKTKATVTNSASPANAAPATAATPADPAKTTEGMVYRITPENAKVEFTGSKVTGKHDGGFKTFSGQISVLNKKVEDSKVSAEVDMNSVFSDDEKLTGHLKSPDFFDVAKFPKSTFVSTKIVADAAKGEGHYLVTGELDFHGQKKTVTFPAKIKIGDKTVEVESEFSINRKDFGVVYAGKADDLIRDDVVIRLSVK